MEFDLANSLADYADRPCAHYDDGRLASYRDLLILGERICDPLGSERSLIFIAGNNDLATLAAYIGAMRRGHVIHLLDPRKPRENAALVANYAPKCVIECQGVDWRISLTGAVPPDLHPDLFLLLSTSGTTGSGKMVKLSYDNINSNTASIIEYLGLTGEDCAPTLLKPCYSYGLSIINSHLGAGGRLLLSDRKLQDRSLWREMAAAKVTNLSGVPNSFEILAGMENDWQDLPELRFMTQAGGALSPALIRRFASLGRSHGWAFFVMYGQTEASPRISYLPPDLVEDHAGSIGRAIPGGELLLRDQTGAEIKEAGVTGELVYRGPNVMIGYAHTADDLADAQQLEELRTGDLAQRDADGLFTLRGRKSRFVKILGLRVSLDEIEADLSASAPAAAVGTDRRIGVFLSVERNPEDLKRQLAERYGLPAAIFAVFPDADLPRLENGKPDYRSLQARLEDQRASRDGVGGSRLARFIRLLPGELLSLLFGAARHVPDIRESFDMVFPRHTPDAMDSFNALAGDSMQFIQMEICLEEFLGYPPDGWPDMTIAELEALQEPEVV